MEHNNRKDEEIKVLENKIKELKAEPPVQEKAVNKDKGEVVKDLVTLAADKLAGHKRETPQIPPTKKKEQYHCAPSYGTADILCTFQWEGRGREGRISNNVTLFYTT